MLDGYFISGTDTNVGKTIVSAILVNKFDGIYFKPIQCGLSLDGKKDSDIIKEICIRKTILEEKYFLKTPASPNIAAKIERKKIKIDDFKSLRNKKFSKKLFVEGAGGLSVPLNESSTMADLAKFFQLPVILVCRTSLGTINHTLLSINLLSNKKIKLRGLVFVGKKELETIKTILKFGQREYNKKIEILATIPNLKKINKSSIDEMKNLFEEL